jgi:hypothetical protein
MGPMYFLTELIGLAGWIALPIVQFVGAIIFWYVDGWIFNDEG